MEHFCSDAIHRLKKEPSEDWKAVAGSGQYFIDNTFKYGSDILYWGSYSERGPIARFSDKIVWQQVSRLDQQWFGQNQFYWKPSGEENNQFKKFSQISLMGSTNEPTHSLKMSQLDNNYFGAAVAAIGNNKDRLEKIIPSKRLNKEGIIAVTFFVKGIPRTVVIDDYLPFETDPSFRTFDLVFANVSPDGGFYLAFLEKAFAKLVGNYGATERVEGTISEALRALNGAPTFSFGIDSFRNPLDR